MLTLLFKPDGDRPNNDDIYYGRRGQAEDPDPTNYFDIYKAPTEGDSIEEAFSHTYTPSSDTQFGCHSAIRNGTPYKLNWRIINRPEIPGADDPEKRIDSERVKISGRSDQGGTGREYGVFMGVQKYIRDRGRGTIEAKDNEVTIVKDVTEGDEIEFVIKRDEMTDAQAGVQNEDIGFSDVRGATEQLRIEADDALQVGEQFMIGRTLWQVVNRDNYYEPRERTATIRLRCTESTTIDDVSWVGIASRAAVNNPIVGPEDGQNYLERKGYVDPDFWPLCKYSLADVRNVRPCDSTEFGIRSQVWAQANGITNLRDVPTPSQQDDYDQEMIQLSEGTVQRYLARTSVFTIWFRPVDSLQTDQGFQPLGDQFLITGESPSDIYNYIRVSHQRLNGNARQFEYRFIPKNSADLKLAAKNTPMVKIDHKLKKEFRRTYETVYGPITVVTAGELVSFDERYWYHEQFYETERSPQYGTISEASNVEFVEFKSVPDVRQGKSAAFTFEMFGHPRNFPNQTKTNDFTVRSGSGTIRVRAKATARDFGNSPEPVLQEYVRLFGTSWRWEYLTFTIVSSSGDVNGGYETEWFNCGRDNTFADAVGMDRVGVVLFFDTQTTQGVIDSGTPTRDWAKKSQIQEVQFYNELSSSCDSGPEHAITYVTEAVENFTDVNYTRLALFGAMIRSSSSLQQIDQLRVWMPDGVTVRLWEKPGEQYGPSNLFCDFAYYLLTDEVSGVGRLANWGWIDEEGFRRTAKFLRANAIHFDTTLTEKQNIREYLTEVAPFNLCNFVIANGAFSMEPALPTDSTGKISLNAVQPKALFTSGNVVDGTFTVTYLEYSERQDFRAVMIYREMDKYGLPQKRSIMLRWKDEYKDYPGAAFPQEEFDISNFCSSRRQAKMVGQFLMSIRRRIDHSIQFQTSPHDLGLAPGDYIKIARVDTPTNYMVPLGVIHSQTGAIMSTDPLPDGEHEVDIYPPGAQDITRVTIEVKNNQVTDQSLWGSVFSAFAPRPKAAIYQVEQLTMTEEGLVEITAVHFPTDENTGTSLVARDTLSTTEFVEIF